MTMYNAEQFDRPPKIRFEAIGEAFNLVKAQAGVWVLTMVIMFAILEGLGFGINFVIGKGMGTSSSSSPFGPQFFVSISTGQIINCILGSFFMGGVYRMALKQVRGGMIQIGDLFSATDIIGSLIGGMLLMALTIDVGFALLVIPGLIAAGALMLTMPLIADKGIGPVEALKTSWEALKGDLLSAVGFVIVAGLASSLGMIACGIGILFTAPIYYLSIAIVYQDYFGGGTVYAEPSIHMPLPPASPGSLDQ